MPSGFITFPGIPTANIKNCMATRTSSCRPDVAILYAIPNGNDPDCSGTATLSFGFNGTIINWTNALCDIGTIQVTGRGQIQVFKILDRRWSWAKAKIVGAYNVVQQDGTVDATTTKTIAQLVTLLFAAIGESVDVSLITSTESPSVVWDYANAADEVEALLSPRGYTVCLATNNTVKIVPKGTGATLPANTDVVSISISVDPPEIPLYLTAVGARTYVQSKMLMVPVGLDTDGSIKPVASLSYCPGIGVTGWDGVDMTTFASITNLAARECALRSVGKWFQVSSQADGTNTLSVGGVDYLPGEITVSSIYQYLPLRKALVTTTSNTFSKKQYNEAYVEVVAFDTWGQPPVSANTAPFTRLDKRDWDLNEEWGIVMFKEPLLKTNGGTPAKLVFGDCYLTCSYSVKDATGIWDRYRRSKNLGGFGEDVQRVEELQRTLTATYTAGTSTLASIADTKSTIDTAADLYLNQAATKYQTQVGTILKYRGIYSFDIDGIATQIVWNCATGGPTPWSTYVSQYCEGLPRLPRERDRAYNRILRRLPVSDVIRQQNYATSRRSPATRG